MVAIIHRLPLENVQTLCSIAPLPLAGALDPTHLRAFLLSLLPVFLKLCLFFRSMLACGGLRFCFVLGFFSQFFDLTRAFFKDHPSPSLLVPGAAFVLPFPPLFSLGPIRKRTQSFFIFRL